MLITIVCSQGRFEILALSGSFLVTESGGTRSRTGGLSVSLAGPDGRVIGGGVAGMLMAASPVQVVSVCVMEEKILTNFQKRNYLVLPNSLIKNEIPSIII